jgi:hypothetical protein
MPSVRFHVDSSVSPGEVVGVLTDFGPSRVEEWSSIVAEHFPVHERGDAWAEVTGGNGMSWVRARCVGDFSVNRVTVITCDSVPFGSGGWHFEMTATDSGNPCRRQGRAAPRLVEVGGEPASPERGRGVVVAGRPGQHEAAEDEEE